MIKELMSLLGLGNNWKHLLIEGQKQVCEALTHIASINALGFLREDEANHYCSPLKFLHDASSYVGKTMVIDNINTAERIVGTCVGYGTVINNVLSDGEILSTVRKFYTVKTNDNPERIVMMDDCMQIVT